MSEIRAPRQVTTDDGSLRFLVSDPLEEYRVRTLATKEPETIAWIDQFGALSGEPAPHFWDIGANIGIFALYAARRHPNLEVLAVEPFFPNFARLKANVGANGLRNVAPLYAALGRNAGLAQFRVTDERFGASGNTVVGGGERPGDVSEKVLALTGADLLRLGFRTPTFIKIDVDGIEPEIMAGMTDVLRAPGVRSLLVEANGSSDLRVIRELCESCGLMPDARFNALENHSRIRRAKDAANTADNWVFTRP